MQYTYHEIIITPMYTKITVIFNVRRVVWLKCANNVLIVPIYMVDE
jgi:hypothetical protein